MAEHKHDLDGKKLRKSDEYLDPANDVLFKYLYFSLIFNSMSIMLQKKIRPVSRP